MLMRTKKFLCGMLFCIIAFMSFVSAPKASAYVSSSIEGCYYKGVVTPDSEEQLIINYNPRSGRAKVTYQVWKNYKRVVYFKLSGSYSNGYLVVSGKGTSYGKRKSMKVRITQVDEENIKVVTGNGSTYYFWAGSEY